MIHDLTIIGAGPAGLEAALAAADAGLDFLIVERGEIAGNIKSWGFLELFSPWKYNVSERGLKVAGLQSVDREQVTSGAEFVERYLLPLAESSLLSPRIRKNTTVISVGRDGEFKNTLIGSASRAEAPFVALVESESGEEELYAKTVIDASGVYGNHRWLGSGGIPCRGERIFTERISYTLEDIANCKERFDGQHVAIVGAGYSACSMLEQFDELYESGCDVIVHWIVARGDEAPIAVQDDDPLPYRKKLGELANSLAHAAPWVKYLPGRSIRALESGGHKSCVALKLSEGANGQGETIEVDHIYAMVGYTPDRSIYAELQVHECWATSGPMKLAATLLSQSGTDCLNVESGGPETLLNPEPGFFIIGAKSYGRNSNFLMERLSEQVPAVLNFICEQVGKQAQAPHH